jgi:hypothetical protein
MARQIVVDIVGDADKFTKSMDAASGKASGFGNVLKGVGMGIGMGALNLATDAVGAFVGQLDDAAKAYREDQASQVKLGQALKNNVANWNGNTDAIEQVIGAQMRLGFGDEEQRDSLSKLVGSTKDITEAQKWQVAAMDLARLKGIDLASATDMMMKASQGNFKALKSVGISLDKNATSADAYAAIMGVAGGQAEAFANTSEGKQLAAQNKVGEAWERIGGVVDQISQVVMPLLADAFQVVVDVIMNGLAFLQPAFDVIGQVIGTVFTTITDAWNRFVGMFQSGSTSTSEEAESLGNIVKSIGEIFGAVFGWIKEQVDRALKGVQIIWNAFGKDIMNAIGTAFDYVKNTIKNALKVVEGIFDIFSGIFSGDWDKVWNGIKKVFEGVWNQIKNIIDTALKLIGGLVSGAWDALVKTISGLGARIGRAASGMWDGIWGAFKAVINSIIRGWNSLKFTLPEVDMGPAGKFGGFTIGTPNIPYLHAGGIVPGAPGSDQLAILQAGERVIPRNQVGSGATEVHIHIDQGAYIDGPSIDRLANLITKRMRYAPAT